MKETPLPPIQASDLRGAWRGLVVCGGSQRLAFGVDLDLDGERGFSAQLTPDVGARTNARAAVLRYEGNLDLSTGFFELRRTKGRRSPWGPTLPVELVGFFSSEAESLTASTRTEKGGVRGMHQWLRCSHALIARPDRIAKLENEEVRKGRSRFRFPECEPEIRGWLERYLRWTPAPKEGIAARGRTRRVVGQSQVWANPYSMLSDPILVPTFGRSFERMSGSDRVALLRFARDPSTCGISGTVGSSRHGLQQLARAVNTPTAVQRSAIDSLALEATTVLLARLPDALRRRPRSADPATDISRLDALEAHIERLRVIMGVLYPNERVPGILAGVEKARASAVIVHLERCAEGPWTSVDDIEASLRCSAEYEGEVSSAERSAALRSLAERLDGDGASVFRDWLASQSGVDGFSEIQRRAPGLLGGFTTSRREELREAAEGRQGEILAVIESDLERRFDAAKHPDATKALSQMAELERDLQEMGSRLRGSGVWARQNAKRARYRQRLLASPRVRTALSAKVGQASSLAELNLLEGRYLLDADRETAAGTRLAAVVESRRDVVAPFRHLQTGDFFNALYAGDFDSVWRIEAEFGSQFMQRFGPSIQAMGRLGDLLSSGTGGGSLSQQLSYVIGNFPMIANVLQVYITEYPLRYAPCVDEDAERFSQKIVEQWVTRNGYGMELYRGPEMVRYRYFTVNRRFLPAWDIVGPNGEGSDFGNLLASLIKGPGQRTTRDFVRDTRTIMRELSCSDPRLRRLEENMVRYLVLKKTKIDRRFR